MKLRLEEIWSKCPGGLLKKPVLLMCNYFMKLAMEVTERTVKELNTQLGVIPGGVTSQLQPLDISVNRPFKAFVHEEWTKWMGAPNHDLTQQDK
jgi:hypothetical protein